MSLPLDHGVGDDRGRMQEDIGIRERSAGARHQLPNAFEDRELWPVRRRQHLLGEDEPALAILQHEIREGPTNVDGDGEPLRLRRELDPFCRRWTRDLYGSAAPLRQLVLHPLRKQIIYNVSAVNRGAAHIPRSLLSRARGSYFFPPSRSFALAASAALRPLSRCRSCSLRQPSRSPAARYLMKRACSRTETGKRPGLRQSAAAALRVPAAAPADLSEDRRLRPFRARGPRLHVGAHRQGRGPALGRRPRRRRRGLATRPRSRPAPSAGRGPAG